MPQTQRRLPMPHFSGASSAARRCDTAYLLAVGGGTWPRRRTGGSKESRALGDSTLLASKQCHTIGATPVPFFCPRQTTGTLRLRVSARE